jgi:mxaA protein
MSGGRGKGARAPVLRWLPIALVAASAVGALQAAPTTLAARVEEPRAYGWRVGDLLAREVRVEVPQGLVLDRGSLPVPGRIGASFELRRADWDGGTGAGVHRLVLEYQVFRSPPAVRTLEVPPITLRFTGTPRNQDLRIDAWPVTVAPLVPVEVSPRRGLGEWQADAAPPRVETSGPRTRLLVYALLALPCLAYLAHVYLGLPWRARRARPFESAWRALRAGPPSPEAAFRRFHQALNDSAGTVLFEAGLADYLAARPQLAGLREELERFFAASRAIFFAGTGHTAEASARLPALLELCRRCRDAERGAA